MLRFAVGSFLILHGIVHVGWATPNSDDPRYPFSPERAWFTAVAHLEAARAKRVFSAIGVVVAVAYGLAGLGAFLGTGWWPAPAVGATVGSLVVMVLGFHPWLTLGVGIDAAILVAIASEWPSSVFP